MTLKILLVSERFFPSVGGVETVTRLLGEAFVRAGHTVTVVNREKSLPDSLRTRVDKRLGLDERDSGGPALPKGTSRYASDFKEWRRPGVIRLLHEHADADAVVVQGLAARLAWPLFWSRAKALLIHHIEPAARDGGVGGWVRRHLAREVRHAAVSWTLAQALPWPVETILPNPYDDAMFRVDPAVGRNRDIIFVGRLVPEKGAHVLVEAIAILRSSARFMTATIVGNGPESSSLAKLIQARELDGCVKLAGRVTGAVLARLLNQHRILVIPSLCKEAFGIIALEGIACGCAILGSDLGGLPEAIGPCGITFPKGDAGALAARVKTLLDSPDTIEKLRAGAERHLAPHRPSSVAQRYLEALAKPQNLPTDGDR